MKGYEAAAVRVNKKRFAVPIQEAFENWRKFIQKAERLKQLMTMVFDEQPFSVVEDQGFCQVTAHLEPHYILRGHCFFADVSLPALYDEAATHS